MSGSINWDDLKVRLVEAEAFSVHGADVFSYDNKFVGGTCTELWRLARKSLEGFDVTHANVHDYGDVAKLCLGTPHDHVVAYRVKGTTEWLPFAYGNTMIEAWVAAVEKL